MDMWNVNGRGQFEAQPYVNETVQKQTELIEACVEGINRIIYLNSETKLVDELAIYKADRAAYFIKDGPKKVLPVNTKYMQIRIEQLEFSAMCLFKDMYDKSSAVQVAVCGQLNTLDCQFQRTYMIDGYTNGTKTNESLTEETESHIDDK
ncbi:MAG: hypothetical protein EZS28_033502 [Streblomastix strix]|uniref:Uncharacterized protein n=1 Tax=Streblomastix strix TaxID=222440 RepID=A0A5J4ULP7_9EUKA|nr:MAG: hypothetical protein EZS28_033502 [Streblomastix strix]